MPKIAIWKSATNAKISNDHASYPPIVTKVEPRFKFLETRGSKLPKSGQNVTTVSPTYVLGSWKLRKTFSKKFLILTTLKLTSGHSIDLLSALLYRCSPGYALKILSMGPKTISFAASWYIKSICNSCFKIVTPVKYMEKFLLGVRREHI